MITNVLKSLVARADVYDPVTGEALHPLLVRREEKNRAADRGHRRKGLAGRIQLQHPQSRGQVH